MSDVSIALGGFGSQGWGNSAWGEGNVSFVATGAIGSVTFILNPIEVTGVAGTASVGSVTVNGTASIPVTGLQATGSVGSVAITGTSNVFPIGVQGTGQVGQVLIWGVINDSQSPDWVIIRTAA